MTFKQSFGVMIINNEINDKITSNINNVSNNEEHSDRVSDIATVLKSTKCLL